MKTRVSIMFARCAVTGKMDFDHSINRQVHRTKQWLNLKIHQNIMHKRLHVAMKKQQFTSRASNSITNEIFFCTTPFTKLQKRIFSQTCALSANARTWAWTLQCIFFSPSKTMNLSFHTAPKGLTQTSLRRIRFVHVHKDDPGNAYKIFCGMGELQVNLYCFR